jgi:acyl dehydratase
VAPSDWFEITQQQVNLFAEATGDHQWIHVDVERARRESPFGAPVAHGFLTLSLPQLMQNAIHMEGVKMGVNYGLNRVRTAPVPVGSRLRAREAAEGRAARTGTERPGGCAVDLGSHDRARRRSDRPVCVAESISRRYS